MPVPEYVQKALDQSVAGQGDESLLRSLLIEAWERIEALKKALDEQG